MISDHRPREAPPDRTEDYLIHICRGSELLQDNRIHEAKQELEQALRLEPGDAKGQDLLAVVLFRLGLYPRAIEIYEGLVRDFPSDVALRQNLALSYLKTGQPQKARSLLEDVVLTEPDHARAWSYLGLVYERLGDYEKARDSFQRGNQTGMARRMDELASSTEQPSHPGLSPELVPLLPGGNGRPEGFHELQREITLKGIAMAAPRSSSGPPLTPLPQAMPSDSLPLRRALDRRAHPSNAAPEDLLPTHPSAANLYTSAPLLSVVPTSSDRPPSLSGLARASQLTFPRETTMAVNGQGLVLVNVETTFATRARHVHLFSTNARVFKATPIMRRMRNRSLPEALGGIDPLLSLEGRGELVLAPRPDERLVVFRMEGEFLFLREEVLVGFEESLAFESGRLAAFEGEAVALVQLRGRGGVVIRSSGALIATEVKAEQSVVLPRERVLGWVGRLLPRQLSPEEAPGGAARLVSFAGDGTVLAGSGPCAVEP
jgi:hypothetical protein